LNVPSKRFQRVVQNACMLLRGEYAKDVVKGYRKWSGAGMAAAARKWGWYSRKRDEALKALRKAGGDVVAVDYGRLVTSVPLCVDDYGAQVYETAFALVRPVTKSGQCREIA
jgi:hypothetical protein